MFNREELLIILEKVDDERIVEKLNAMLFVDDRIISELTKLFKNNELLKIEKDNDKNEYYIHLIEDKVDILEVLKKLLLFLLNIEQKILYQKYTLLLTKTSKKCGGIKI